MKNTVVIKKNYEFKNLFSKGKFYYGEYIHVYVLKNKEEYNKFGIAISKKFGKAVKRNRIKRLIRESYKNLESRIEKGNSILVIINKNIKNEDVSYKNIENNFSKLLKKANILNE